MTQSKRKIERFSRRLSEARDVTTAYLVGGADDPAPPLSAGEPLFGNFSSLTTSDREVAREIVAQLALRSKRIHA